MNTALPTTLSFTDQLQTTKSYIGKLGAAQPETMAAFSRLHNAAAAPGALDTSSPRMRPQARRAKRSRGPGTTPLAGGAWP